VDLSDVAVVITVPAMFAFIIWVVFSTIRRYKVTKVQSEIQTKLLEKFGSSQELLAYLETDAGRYFLESTSLERSNPLNRILTSVQVGLILSLLGIALLIVARIIPEEARGLAVSGTVSLALGVGFLLSAGASYYLSKSLGLLENKPVRQP
jgi:hypothetical protein